MTRTTTGQFAAHLLSALLLAASVAACGQPDSDTSVATTRATGNAVAPEQAAPMDDATRTETAAASKQILLTNVSLWDSSGHTLQPGTNVLVADNLVRRISSGPIDAKDRWA